MQATTTVVCQVFHPDEQSTSQLLSEVIGALGEEGFPLDVWSGYPGVHRGRRPASREQWRGTTITRLGWRGSVKKSMALRLLTYVSYTLGVALRLTFGPKRCVVAVTNPPFLPVVVWAAAVVRRHPFKLILQDVYPDGLVATGRLRRGGLAERFWRAANRRAFHAAEELWVLGRDMAALVRACYGVPADRIRIVPNWSPVEFAEPSTAEQTRLAIRLGLGGKFIVQYSGNMGLWHDLDTIVRAAAALQHRPEVHFLFIGGGRQRADAETLAQELRLQNVTWLPYQEREHLADSLACCHAALISQREGLEGVAVPCKLYGILAAGRAVVAQVPAGSEVALAVREEGCGRVVIPGDANALAECIQELAENPAAAAELGRRARSAYLARYTQQHGLDAFRAGLARWQNSAPVR